MEQRRLHVGDAVSGGLDLARCFDECSKFVGISDGIETECQRLFFKAQIRQMDPQRYVATRDPSHHDACLGLTEHLQRRVGRAAQRSVAVLVDVVAAAELAERDIVGVGINDDQRQRRFQQEALNQNTHRVGLA